MTAAKLLPADVQLRADAELGAAWRRCEAALPEGWYFDGLVRYPEGEWRASAVSFGGTLWRSGESRIAALDALTESLEALRDD